MVKEKSTKKGGMAKEEILSKLKKFDRPSPEAKGELTRLVSRIIKDRSRHDKIKYLNSILNKKGLLKDKTRESIYVVLAESAEKDAEKYKGEKGTYQGALSAAGGWYMKAGGASNNKDYYEKANKVFEKIDKGSLASRFARKKAGLEQIATVILAIASIGIGIFFLSPNLTGNAIANFTNQTSSIIGAVLILIGIISTFIYFKKAKKKE